MGNGAKKENADSAATSTVAVARTPSFPPEGRVIPEPDRYAFMEKKEREKMDRLCRRALHLKGRIAASEREMSWDRAEYSALEWALEMLIKLYP
jgi:hypothetical protein